MNISTNTTYPDHYFIHNTNSSDEKEITVKEVADIVFSLEEKMKNIEKEIFALKLKLFERLL